MQFADLLGQFGTVGHPVFVQEVQAGAGEDTDHQIGGAQAPQAHTGGAHRRQFVVPRVIGKGVEQGEQKGRGQDDLLQPSWRLNEVIASDLRRPELFLLERSQFGKQIEGNPQYKNTTQTVAERNEQFAQQVTV